MHRSKLPVLASLTFLAAACSNNNQSTNNPEAGAYDDYYSETGAGSGASGGGGQASQGDAPAPRAAAAATFRERRKGKPKELIAKKPPVKGGEKPKKPVASRDVEKAELDGVVPTAAKPGSLVEIYGAGLDRKGLGVSIGGRPQKVRTVEPGRLVVEYTGGKGVVALTQPSRGGRAPRGAGGAVLDKSTVAFENLGRDNPFGGHTTAGHGLLGKVYPIESEVSEVPAFDSLGEPVATIMVDQLDIPSTEFTGKIAGKDEWFAIHFDGSLNVVEAGEYELCLAAGSGALLFLNEALIVDNDGRHETQEVCEAVYIEPGEYLLDLLYYQAEKPELGLTLSWAKDGGTKAPIPAEAFFPPEELASLARE